MPKSIQTYKFKYGKNVSFSIGVPCRLRASIYNNKLIEAYAEFEKLATQHGQYVYEALVAQNLVEELAHILDQYVVSAVYPELHYGKNSIYSSRFNQIYYGNTELVEMDKFFDRTLSQNGAVSDDKAYENYFELVINADVYMADKSVKPVQDVQKSGVDGFYLRNPRTAYIVDKLTSNFVNNITNLVKRITQDRDLVSTYFFKGNMMRIVKIESKAADFHKGGQQVLILTLHKAKMFSRYSVRKLVYKPTDLEWDCYVFGQVSSLKGNSEIQTILSSTLQQDQRDLGLVSADRASYFLVDESLAEYTNRKTSMSYTPSYKILPRRPGSLFDISKVDPNSINVSESYGYIEFLESDKESSNESQIQDFYKSWGNNMAIAGMFSIRDLHIKNIIVSNKKPYLIDCEYAMSDPSNNIGKTAIFTNFEGSIDYGSFDGNVNYDEYVYKITDDYTGKMTVQNIVSNELKEYHGNKIIDAQGNPYMVTVEDCKLIFDQFQNCLRQLSQQSDLVDWLSKLDKIMLRYIPGGTSIEHDAFSYIYGYSNVSKAFQATGTEKVILQQLQRKFPDSKYPWNQEVIDDIKWGSGGMNYCLAWTERGNSTNSIANGDFPHYTHRVDGKYLYNDQGKYVDSILVSSPDFFPESSLILVSNQLNSSTYKQALIKSTNHSLASYLNKVTSLKNLTNSN